MRARAALSEAELADVQRLAALCRLHAIEPRLVWAALTHPGEQPSHFLHYDAGRLVGFLTVDGLESDTPEGALLADPTRAPEASIDALLGAVQALPRPAGATLLLPIDRRAEAPAAALQARGYVRHATECLLRRDDLRPPALAAGEPEVARATPADAPAIADILAEDLGIAPGELEHVIGENMRRPGYRYFIARLADAAVGTLNVQILNGAPYIYGFVVRPEYQGRGYGRRIIAHALAATLAAAPQPIYLEVEPDNTPAYTLYKSLGFALLVTYDYYREAGVSVK